MVKYMEDNKMKNNNKPNDKRKGTPEEYDRWGRIGIKVISKPNNEPRKKEK